MQQRVRVSSGRQTTAREKWPRELWWVAVVGRLAGGSACEVVRLYLLRGVGVVSRGGAESPLITQVESAHCTGHGHALWHAASFALRMSLHSVDEK